MRDTQAGLEKLKEEYERIEAPACLSGLVEASVKGVGNPKRGWGKSMQKAGVAVAAVLVILTVGVNVSSALAQELRQVPILGTLVGVLQFRDGEAWGGKPTDGSDVRNIVTGFEENIQNITLEFTAEEQVQETAGSFRIQYSKYPAMMTFSFGGARRLSAERYFEQLQHTGYIQDVYKLITMDDSMVRFAVTFTEPVQYEVREYRNPAKIIVSFTRDTAPETKPVYSVRSHSMPRGEQLGIAEEVLFGEKGLRLLKDEGGTFVVETAYFSQKREAEEKLKELQEKHGDMSWRIEKRGPQQLPAVQAR